jgi:conjugative transfer signal peptidase TraF
MKRRCWILRIATAATGCAVLLGISVIGYRLPKTLGYCLNLTPSEPAGIYRLVPGGAERGALVWLQQPMGPEASMLHRYAPAKIPLIKRVAAIPGDTVKLERSGVLVNGTPWPDSAQLTRDAEGHALYAFPFGIYRIAAGQLWVMSQHPRGIDSRYFGQVPESSVISRLTPVLTWSYPAVSQALLLFYIIVIVVTAVMTAAAIVRNSYTLIINPRELGSGE